MCVCVTDRMGSLRPWSCQQRSSDQVPEQTASNEMLKANRASECHVTRLCATTALCVHVGGERTIESHAFVCAGEQNDSPSSASSSCC